MAELMRPGEDAVDAAALRVEVAIADQHPGDEALVIVPPGESEPAGSAGDDGAKPRLDRVDAARAFLRTGDGRLPILFGAVGERKASGSTVVEVVVNGWRVELEIQPERRAQLRERAATRRGGGSAGGPLEVRAIIPGRVVAVSVEPGDEVSMGQQLLVIEAMKMQNELRATRAGKVARIAVEAGRTIEVGDILLVLE
jgi:biotin carboxyl carrier protein